MVIGVASDTFEGEGIKPDEVVAALASWLGTRTATKQIRTSSMRTSEFLQCCEKAGLRVKRDTQGYQIFGPKGGTTGIVKINNSTRAIPGGVLRIYLQNLGLTEAATGISIDEFQEGISDEKALLHRFHSVLKRLAHA